MLQKLEGWIEPGSEEEALVRRVDFSRIPVHVAVIMDGNGRWASQRNLPRAEGHKAGAKSVQEVVEAAARLGVRYLTLYAFSRENWKRPQKEVAMLWRLLESYLKREYRVLIKNEFRLRAIGRLEEIPPRAKEEMVRVMDLTKGFDRLTIVAALNYSGREEILDGVGRYLADPNRPPGPLTEETFGRYLDTAGLPDPDLLIRTSGEFRVSNFLLWQIAYAEIWITSEFWPDFRKKHFLQAIIDYQKRERRFGDIMGR